MRSIRSIIFVRLFAINIIFFAVVSGVAYLLTSEAIKQFVVDDAVTSLSFVINNIKSNYESELTALNQIADLPGMSPYDSTQSQHVIQEFLELPNIFNTVHLYQADGTLLVAERRGIKAVYKASPNFHQKDPAFIALAERVIREKQSIASEVFVSPSGRVYQTFLTPVFSDAEHKQVFGILSGGVFPQLQKIDYLLRGLKLGKNNFILITDSKGHLISSDGISEKEAETSVRSQTDQAAKRFFGQDGSQSRDAFINHRIKIDRFSYILISLPADPLKLIVTLGVSTQGIETKTRELSYRLLVALVLGLFLSLVASIFVGDRLAKPFRMMAETINEINKGNFAARVQYIGDDEIGYLSKALNTLSEKIQKSEYLGNLWSTEEQVEEMADIQEVAEKQEAAEVQEVPEIQEVAEKQEIGEIQK
jgi:HAMP domain-containing protein